MAAHSPIEGLFKSFNITYPKEHKKKRSALKQLVTVVSNCISLPPSATLHNIRLSDVVLHVLQEFAEQVQFWQLRKHTLRCLSGTKCNTLCRCKVCGAENTKICSACLPGRDPGFYCSKDCQKKDWPAHRLVCKDKMKKLTSSEMVSSIERMMNKPLLNGQVNNNVIFYVSAAVFSMAGIYSPSSDITFYTIPHITNNIDMANAKAFLEKHLLEMAKKMRLGHDQSYLVMYPSHTFMEGMYEWMRENETVHKIADSLNKLIRDINSISSVAIMM